jgi:hypothetical protein
MTAISQDVCPRLRFTGLKVDCRKELSLALGDYCKVFDGLDNMSKSRNIPCNALYPSSNATGSWIFFSDKTQKQLR